MKIFFRLQMKQLNGREHTYPQLLLDAPDLFEACRLKNNMTGLVTIASIRTHGVRQLPVYCLGKQSAGQLLRLPDQRAGPIAGFLNS